ncbi:MAG: choice-of-anchor D domain-containing protein, partial [Candidatus Handelsmanbacteria bacterium]|nr:choice-of-anchor D domain-containing protein [Candidatus Handelsmanbacteria bacterium]
MQPGASQQVEVAFAPLALTNYAGTLTIESNSWNSSSRNAVVKLQGQGVRGVMRVDSSALDFGALRTKRDAKTDQLTIENTGNISLDLYGVTTDNPQFLLLDLPSMPLTLESGEQRTFALRFAPTDLGDQTGEVVFITSDPLEPLLTVDLTGKGVAPRVTTSGDTMEFGAVRRSVDRLAHKVALSNTGDDVALIRGLSSSNPNFVVASRQVDLAPGATETFEIQFAPVRDGGHQAVLRTWGDLDPYPGEDTLSVFLGGTGIAPKIAVFPDSLDFGGVQFPSSSIRRLAIQNIGTAELRLDSAAVDAGVFQLPGAAVSQLAIGERVALDLTFTPPPEAGEFGGRLGLYSDDPDQPALFVPVKGQGVSTQLAYEGLDFGEVEVGAGKGATMSLTVTNQAALGATGSISIADPQFAIAETEYNIPPGKSQTFAISFTPGARGPVSAAARLTAADGSVFEVPLQGTGIQPELSVPASEIQFGAVLVGTRDTTEVVVRNKGTAPLTINGVTLKSNQDLFSVVPEAFSAIPREATYPIKVNFRPPDTGVFADTLVVSSDGGSGEVLVRGSGVRPVLNAASLLDFGQVLRRGAVPGRGDQNRLSLPVSNAGQEVLLIEEVRIEDETGQFQLATSLANTEIAPGQSQELVVAFAPAKDGEQNASLLLRSRPPQEDIRVPLKGVGVSPIIHLNPEAVDFDDTKINVATDPETFTIENRGDTTLVVSELVSGDPKQFQV